MSRIAFPGPAAGIGGRSRAESVEYLTQVRDRCSRIAWLLSGRLMIVEEFEAKLAFAEHIHELLSVVDGLQRRLAELAPATPTEVLPCSVTIEDRATLHAPDTRHFVERVYGVLLPEAVKLVRAYACDAALSLDGPSVRVLRLADFELEGALGWGADAVEACRQALDAQALARLRSWANAPTSTDPDAPRATRAARDERFTLFADTRRYSDDPHDGDEAVDRERYDATVVELARVNRDEIDAVETFAIALHDLLFDQPYTMMRDLARLLWDEARHAVIGHELLAHLGYDPYEFPCSMIGINVRGAMSGWDAFAQISLLGEAAIIGRMRSLAQAAAARGDAVVANVFDFVVADERMHLKRGHSWLTHRHPDRPLQKVRDKVVALSCQRLADEGVVGEDYTPGSVLELAEMIGE